MMNPDERRRLSEEREAQEDRLRAVQAEELADLDLGPSQREFLERQQERKQRQAEQWREDVQAGWSESKQDAEAQMRIQNNLNQGTKPVDFHTDNQWRPDEHGVWMERPPARGDGRSKVCTKCGIERFVDEFALRSYKYSKDGRQHWCRKCFAKRYDRVGTPPRGGGQMPVERVNTLLRYNGKKVCSKCRMDILDAHLHFHRCKSTPDGLARQCKQCRGEMYREQKKAKLERKKQEHAARLKANQASVDA